MSPRTDPPHGRRAARGTGTPDALSSLAAGRAEAATVRPYTMTGGRVASRRDLPIEALVATRAGSARGSGMTREKRALLQFAAQGYVSVAELSARLRLPLGVVRVLIEDLAADGHVDVHVEAGRSARDGVPDHTVPLHVLESVLDGIDSL